MSRLKLALAFTLAGLFLLLSSSWNNSPSYDEPEHVTAGYCFVSTGRNFMNPQHPPLVKDLAGLSVRLLINPPHPPAWQVLDPRQASLQLFSGQTDVQTMIRCARLPIILLNSLFFGFFFAVLARSQGERAAAWATLMLLLCPSYLAHGSMVHTDVAAAVVAFASLWLLARHLEEPECPKRLGWFAIVCAVAQLVKYSMLLLYAYYLLVILLRADRWQRLKQVPRVLLTGLVIVWGVYFLHPIPRRYQEHYNQNYLAGYRDPALRLIQETGRISYLRSLSWYGTGLYAQVRHLSDGHVLPGYLAGRQYSGGDWRFFPTLLLTKIPPGLWALFLLSLLGLRSSCSPPSNARREVQLLLGFAALYFLIAVRGSLNLGLRHLLPMAPCLCAAAGHGLARVTAHKATRAAMGLALASAIFSLARSWPAFLPYFNLLAGDKPVALGSDYDWGCDLLRLKQRADKEDWKPVYTIYYGRVPPAAYLGPRHAVMSDPLPTSGWVAYSMTRYLPWKGWLAHPLPADCPAKDRDQWNWGQRLEEVTQVGSTMVLRIR